MAGLPRNMGHMIPILKSMNQSVNQKTLKSTEREYAFIEILG